MIKNFTSLPRKTLLILLVVIIAAGAGVYVHNHQNKTYAAVHPEYLNFAGNYVFGVPKNYAVDEQSVPGAQLVYSGQITAATLQDIYNDGGLSVQQISDLTDHSSGGFKKYAKGPYLSEIEKNLSTSDIKIKFAEVNSQDVARITVNKNGQEIRFIYLKGGQDPAVIVANSETAAVTTVEHTIVDVQASDLSGQIAGIRQAIESTAQLIKAQNAQSLYSSATPALKAKSTETQLASALQSAAAYTGGNIVIYGITYAPGNFSAGLRLTKLDKNDQTPAYGAISEQQVSGQWQLTSLTLPAPK